MPQALPPFDVHPVFHVLLSLKKKKGKTSNSCDLRGGETPPKTQTKTAQSDLTGFLIELELNCGFWSDILGHRLDYVCMLGQPVNRRITKSAGFTYLTQTFLFCSCIPALHDCSGCGLKDFGCWQPRDRKSINFYCCRLLRVSGQYRKCSTCVEVSNMVFTLG